MSPLSIIISFSSEYVISESEKKYAQLKHVYKRKQSKTVLNNCVGIFFKCERTKGDGLFHWCKCNYVLYYFGILSRSDVWKFKNSDFDFIRYQWMNWSGVDYCHVFKFELPFWRHPFTVEYPSIGEQVMYSIQFSFKEMLWVHYKSSSTSVAQSWSLQKTMVTNP